MNWDDLSLFDFIEMSKLLIASKKLRVEPTTIARRIKKIRKKFEH